MHYRAARLDETLLLATFNVAMLRECDLTGSGLRDDWQATLGAHYAREIASGTMCWLVAESGGVVVATACITINGGASNAIYLDPSATLSGVYVLPEHRGNGIARELTERAIVWCREHGCAWMRLLASDAGRPLYESLGFVDGTEMRLHLR